MKVLISGFQPFGEHTINPTELLVQALKDKKVVIPQGMLIDGIILPVSFSKSFDELRTKIEEMDPDIILCFGLASTRDSIEFERVAINYMDTSIPDNDGEHPRDQLVDAKGETAYFSTLPVRKLETVLKSAKIPVRISNSAGTYVCNYLFYQMMKSNQNSNRQCGFIHVPSEASINLVVIIQALELILQTLLANSNPDSSN